MKHRTVVQLVAPRYGSVIDYNIFGGSESVCRTIIKDLIDRRVQMSLAHPKCGISSVKLKRRANTCALELRIHEAGTSLKYVFRNVHVRRTIGGLAWNILQNILALNRAFGPVVKLDAKIGLPANASRSENLKQQEWKRFCVAAKPRLSVMIDRCDEPELNIASMEAEANHDFKRIATPDVVIISSHPADEYERELARCTALKQNNPDLRVFFNPGRTQVLQGVERAAAVLRFTSLATMKLDEAVRFLAIRESTNRTATAHRCLKELLRRGVLLAVLNDSSRGSYLGTTEGKFHLSPFPEARVARMIGPVQHTNFSGCGDAMFSVLAYLQCSTPKLDLRTQGAFASAIARLISLLPESHLGRVPTQILQSLWKLCAPGKEGC